MTTTRVRSAELIYTEHQGKKHYRDDLSLPMLVFHSSQELVGLYCVKSRVLYQEPAEVRYRFYKTPHRIYEIEVIERSALTESEFQQIEAMPKYGNVDEIWKCYTRFDKNSHPDDELIIEERTDRIGTFFHCEYDNDLSKLISTHVWNGWTRTEVIAAIHKLLKLDDEESRNNWKWKDVLNLRKLVAANPELLRV